MKAQALYARAKQLMPGGTQLLSKRPEMFLPEQWPTYYREAKGAELVDIEGRRLVDMSYCGIGATVLGFADPDVNAAVKRAIDLGSMSTLNCREEVDLAELLVELHPWADMVRFSRSGGEALAIAIRIARAVSGRDMVAFCGYHGWHDWYLSANLAEDDALDGHLLPGLAPRGVPRGLAGLLQPFQFNDVEALEGIVARHGTRLGAIILEPVRSSEPSEAFVAAVNRVTERSGAVLIVDEVTSGLRLNSGGAHLLYGYRPAMAVFAKALGNGFPVSAVVGTRAVMEAAQDTFISSTAWTERTGSAAALATLSKHRDHKVPAHLIEIGRSVQDGWKRAGEASGVDIQVSGIAPLGHFAFAVEPVRLKTYFTQAMLDRGFLATTSFYAMYAHTPEQVERYLEAVAEVFQEIRAAQETGTLADRLRGPEAHTGFRRLTG